MIEHALVLAKLDLKISVVGEYDPKRIIIPPETYLGGPLLNVYPSEVGILSICICL